MEMDWAWEALDLLPSSEEDDASPTKAAVSTLQAFVPRKEKNTSVKQSKSDAPPAGADGCAGYGAGVSCDTACGGGRPHGYEHAHNEWCFDV